MENMLTVGRQAYDTDICVLLAAIDTWPYMAIKAFKFHQIRYRILVVKLL